jgi:hypothetical protein
VGRIHGRNKRRRLCIAASAAVAAAAASGVIVRARGPKKMFKPDCNPDYTACRNIRSWPLLIFTARRTFPRALFFTLAALQP